MIDPGFPADEYTPHGYLANPFAVAHSWSDGEGGCLRTTRDYVGFGWQLPWALRPQARVDLVVSLESDGQQLVTRADFDAAGLISPHHSANLFVYRWQAFGRIWEAAYTLVERDALGLQVTWQPSTDDASGTSTAPDVTDRRRSTLTIGLIGWRQESPAGDSTVPFAGAPGPPDQERILDADGWIDLGQPYGRCEVVLDAGELWRGSVAVGQPAPDPEADPSREWQATINAAIEVGKTPAGSVWAVARRVITNPHPSPLPEGEGAELPPGALLPLSPGSDVGAADVRAAQRVGAADVRAAQRRGRGGEGQHVAASIAQARTDDDAFWRGATHLEGAWPASWRRGWVYDTETTRMCVYPPGGIFTDVWPAWMVQWPRAVVAEGTLDMARFAYASPELAQRALLSLFRDAEAPNVPCVFQHGEPNMVASDGSICGTSPAWCVPFYNLERLFSLTLDRAWLAEIYPYLKQYLEWWLAERTDSDGWAVYKCTWEAGEDDTPRLDPERRGDNVVSAYVLPVELQATMALSAGVMRRFAKVLGETGDDERWHNLEAEYLARTRELWDPVERRFRDWDARNGRFLAPTGEVSYWGVDVCRYSALAFTPLLAGISDDDVRAGLWEELQQYDGPPWTLWASWSYVILEAARLTADPGVHARTGDPPFAGRVAAGIVGRVYDELDARQIADPRHPSPGVAREYWPLDLDTWASCEGYGWGANTASLLVRQVFGFIEGPYLDAATPLTFELRPALPVEFLVPGREYALVNLPYRGARLSLHYRVADAPPSAAGLYGGLDLLVSADVPTRCRVVDTSAPLAWESVGADDVHEIPLLNGGVYTLTLELER